MIYWTYPMQQNKYPWRDLKKKQELKFVTVLTFYLVMWSLKLNYKDLIGCWGFFSLFIVFSETTCYFHEKKNIILFNSHFSFYFFQNMTNFDIDSYSPLLHNNTFWRLWNFMYMEILWKMEHYFCSIGANARFFIIFSKVFKT